MSEGGGEGGRGDDVWGLTRKEDHQFLIRGKYQASSLEELSPVARAEGRAPEAEGKPCDIL